MWTDDIDISRMRKLAFEQLRTDVKALVNTHLGESISTEESDLIETKIYRLIADPREYLTEQRIAFKILDEHRRLAPLIDMRPEDADKEDLSYLAIAIKADKWLIDMNFQTKTFAHRSRNVSMKNAIGLESLDKVELVMHLETAFDISVPDDATEDDVYADFLQVITGIHLAKTNKK